MPDVSAILELQELSRLEGDKGPLVACLDGATVMLSQRCFDV